MATRTRKTPVRPAPTTLDPRIFSYEINPALLTQVLHVYRDNSHQDTSKVKSRGELTRTTKKMYKQKGTGNARHGSRMSPTFVGGGVAHGPTGLKPNNLKLNQKMKAAALAGILTSYSKEKSIEIVTIPTVDKPSAKAFRSLFPKEKTLFVYHQDGPTLISSLRNLSGMNFITANQLNAYHVAGSRFISLTPSAHDAIVSRLTPLIKSKKEK